MIIESLSAINDPFLAKRTAAEDAFDHRLKHAELDCPDCRGFGWVEDDYGIRRCAANGCRGGTLYLDLCIRCRKDDSHCLCSVSDFT